MEEEIQKIFDKSCIEGGYKWKFTTTFEDAVLDKFFWQALGKACGWETQPYLCQDCKTIGFREGNHMNVCARKYRYGSWKDEALRFHEINITESWDAAVAYLTSITK